MNFELCATFLNPNPANYIDLSGASSTFTRWSSLVHVLKHESNVIAADMCGSGAVRAAKNGRVRAFTF